ncbi:MAG: hypothetical protein J1F13_07245 [Prevotellaceae bacterium]|nr:hypothetical protein [Prevotellaceae bacterium]
MFIENSSVEGYPYHVQERGTGYNYYLNMNGSGGVQFNTWYDSDGAGGCIYNLTVKNTNFNPTEAKKMLEDYFNPSALVKYIVLDAKGNIVASVADVPAKAGETITDIPADLKRAFCTYNVPQTVVVAGSQTITATVTYNLPFNTDGTAYYFTARNPNYHHVYYDANASNNLTVNKSGKEISDVYWWKFSGNPYDGITVQNVASGTYLAGEGATVQLATEPYAWVLRDDVGGIENNFGLRVNNGSYSINQSGTSLSGWTGFDIGSYLSVEEIELPIEISEVEWATFSAPIATTIPKDVTAYIATGVNDGKLVIEPIDGDVIPANTGVLLNASEGTYNFASTADVNNIENNIFVGTTAEITVDALSVYVLANNEDKGLGFYLLNDTRVPANKAYIPVNSDSKAANFLGFGDSDITAIESAEAAADAAAQSAIHYDLQGRRVAAPQKGQLYIVNGKKVLY